MAAESARPDGQAAVPVRAQVQTPHKDEVYTAAMEQVDKGGAVESDQLHRRLWRLVPRLPKGPDESKAGRAAV